MNTAKMISNPDKQSEKYLSIGTDHDHYFTAGIPISRTTKLYKLSETIATTIRSQITRAVDLSNDRPVVVKSCLSTNPSWNDDLERERRILECLSSAGCTHPNIINILDSASDSTGQVYSIFEFCQGGDMLTRVQQTSGFAEDEARKCITQLLSAVDFLHQRHICHLDISLENMLLSSNSGPGEWHVKLCDFGVAQDILAETGTTRKLQGKVGKLGCMAPEVYFGGTFDAEKADLWSCGIVLFVMLTGCPPFVTPSKVDVRFEMLRVRGVRALLEMWKFNEVLTEPCMDFLSRMLCPPGSRWSAATLLKHPWISLLPNGSMDA